MKAVRSGFASLMRLQGTPEDQEFLTRQLGIILRVKRQQIIEIELHPKDPCMEYLPTLGLF